MTVVRAGIRRPVICANGMGEWLRRIGGRTGMAGGFPIAGRRFLLIGSGVLAAVPLIICSQTGAAPRAAGVIHKQSTLRRSGG
jgi:hypothetical protein